jgi:hypothetical protein
MYIKLFYREAKEQKRTMSKKLMGTASEDNYTYVKEVIGFENWDSKLNAIINEMRAKEHNHETKTTTK